MMALSLWQPWATLWLRGPKVHETRGREMKYYRGWLAVHAAKRKPQPALITPELDAICKRDHGLNWRHIAPLGKVIGAVYITDCFATDDLFNRPVNSDDEICGDWSAGRFAIRREDTIILPEPRDVIGRQSLFYLPDDLRDWFDFHIIKNDLRDAAKIAEARGSVRNLIHNGMR